MIHTVYTVQRKEGTIFMQESLRIRLEEREKNNAQDTVHAWIHVIKHNYDVVEILFA